MTPITRIRTITFRSNVAIGKFQHAHIEVTADVPLNRKPESVLVDLQRFVAKELTKVREGEVKNITVQKRLRFTDMVQGETYPGL